MNIVLETETFTNIYPKLEKTEKEWIDKIKDQLKENLIIGKPLHYPWFREKRFKNKRLYFLINPHTHKTILHFFEDKKEQQKVIDHLILNKERYLRQIR